MPFNQWLWLQRLKDVEREFLAVRFSTEEMLRIVRSGSYVLVNGIDVADLVRTVSHLEGTYTIRLFSEFESGVRQHWKFVRGKDSPSRTRDLIDGSATYSHISSSLVTDTHAIRDYRNDLVHERDQDYDPVPLPKARSTLCRFFSLLRN